jgi:hypothetical protein
MKNNQILVEKIKYYEFLIELCKKSKIKDKQKLNELNLKHIQSVDEYVLQEAPIFAIGTAAVGVLILIKRIRETLRLKMYKCNGMYTGDSESLKRCRVSVTEDAIASLEQQKSKCNKNQNCINKIQKQIDMFKRAKVRYEKYQDLGAPDAGRSNEDRGFLRRISLPSNK